MNKSDIITRVINNKVFWLLLVFLTVFFTRLHGAPDTVIDWDESIYFTMSQDMLHGGKLYETLWDNKGPLLFFVFAPVIKIFDNNIFALRIFTTIYLIISMLFVYLIAKRFFDSKISLIPPLVYGLFFKEFGGMASNGELFMMLPAIIAAYCFIIYLQKNSRSMLLMCGIFSAAAMLFKQTALFSIALFPILLIIRKFRTKDCTWKALANNLMWYAFGGIAAVIVVLIHFIINGTVSHVYTTLIALNSQYTGFITFQEALQRLIYFLIDRMRTHAITMIALASLLFVAAKKSETQQEKQNTIFILGLLAFSLIGVFWGRQMFHHYYLQAAFPIALLIGLALSKIPVDKIISDKVICWILLIAALVTARLEVYSLMILIIAAIVFTANSRIDAKTLHGVALIVFVILLISGLQPIRDTYERYEKKNDELHQVADYIIQNSGKDDTIFVLGGQPVVHFLSKRASPTKYFFWVHHLGSFQNLLKIKDSSLAEFSANPPKYIVFGKDGDQVEYLHEFMLNNYHEETQIGGIKLYRLNSI